MLLEFMMFINASINMDHRQFTFQLESMFCALSVLEEKYIFKWVEMEHCACITFQLQKHFYKSHNSIYKSGIFLKNTESTHTDIILYLYMPEQYFLTRVKYCKAISLLYAYAWTEWNQFRKMINKIHLKNDSLGGRRCNDIQTLIEISKHSGA